MTGRLAGSLQNRLLWSLVAAIFFAAFVEAGLAYRTALTEVDTILDNYMQRTAWSLRAGPTLAGGEAPLESPEDEGNYDLFVQVWSADGLRIFQSSAHIVLPVGAVLGFANVNANGTAYRVYSLQAGPRVIQVAQKLSARRIAAGTLALRTVVPILLMAPLLVFVSVWVVRRSLVSVARVRRQVAERKPDDLSEVSATGLPDEIRPLVEELNLLFGRVRRAFEAQQHFVADAAHELRSPLAALKLQVQSLQRAPDDAARSLAMERLTSGIDRATQLVGQLLILARQEARLTADEPPERLSLLDLARDAVVDITPVAEARGIDVGLVDSDPAVIDGHADALHILLRNLLDNAIKYTPAGGFVDVEVRASPGEVILAVEDSGTGIPAEAREHVLGRFHRGTNTGVPGSGLGLAIVQVIAKLHTATIALEASARRGGLRAVVRFPHVRGSRPMAK
jgi:two-component system, OmpR family, sensor kinase